MLEIEKIINDICPNGVEYKPLVECCVVLDNKRKPVTKSAREGGEYPYYGANGIQDYVSDYIFDGVFVLVGEDGSVITPNGNPVVNWAEGKIWVNNHAHIIAEKEGVLLRYLYHYLQTVNISSLVHGNIPKLTGSDFKAIQVPLPPLAAQREIVHVLDKFTLLSSELAAELAARRVQYEYYRDDLLKVKDNSERVSIADICIPTKNIKWKDAQGTYKYIDLSSVDRDTHLIQAESVIDKDSAPSRAQQIVLKDDVLYATTRPTLRRYCIINDEYDNQICSTGFAVLRSNRERILPKYLYFIVSSTAFLDYVEANQEGTSYPAISDGRLKEFRFNLPSIETQSRLVFVLENFDKICADLKIGLPAEIEKRQQQYEYYRDKLFAFKKLS